MIMVLVDFLFHAPRAFFLAAPENGSTNSFGHCMATVVVRHEDLIVGNVIDRCELWCHYALPFSILLFFDYVLLLESLLAVEWNTATARLDFENAWRVNT